MFAGAPITMRASDRPLFCYTCRGVLAGSLHSAGMFSDLDGLAVQRIVGFLEVSELARTSCASHDLSTVCAEETEARARARIKLSWYGISGQTTEEACNALLSQPYARIRLYPTSDLWALAAQYCGGWGPLLARRDGVDVSVQQAAAAGPVPTADDCLVLWEVVVDSGPHKVHPLCERQPRFGG